MNGHEFAGLSRGAGRESALFARHGGEPAINTRISAELDHGAPAISAARAALDALAHRLDDRVVDDARLLVSELVTNSVRHSGADVGSHVRLDAVVDGDALHVEVSDTGSGFEPRPRAAGQSPGSGWGLYLVDRLADRWGVATNGFTTVWFEMDGQRS